MSCGECGARARGKARTDMTWTVIVARKGGVDQKSRLASRLNEAERAALCDAMATHVLGVLDATPDVSRIIVLSETRELAGAHEWLPDKGRSMNVELGAFAWAHGGDPLLVLHGDLPMLRVEDACAMMAATETHDIAIAPDHAGRGTNGVALGRGVAFEFFFGEDSFRKHVYAAGARAAIVRRPGLALDVDVPADLDAAIAANAPGLPAS